MREKIILKMKIIKYFNLIIFFNYFNTIPNMTRCQGECSLSLYILKMTIIFMQTTKKCPAKDISKSDSEDHKNKARVSTHEDAYPDET